MWRLLFVQGLGYKGAQLMGLCVRKASACKKHTLFKGKWGSAVRTR